MTPRTRRSDSPSSPGSKRFSREQAGATLTEYALVLTFIMVVCVVAVGFVGINVKSIFNRVANTI